MNLDEWLLMSGVLLYLFYAMRRKLLEWRRRWERCFYRNCGKLAAPRSLFCRDHFGMWGCDDESGD